MNPLILRQIDQLKHAAQTLGNVIEQQSSDIEHQQEQRETLQQEVWKLRKESSALQRMADDYDQLQDENDRATARTTELRQGLETVLECIKALRAEFSQP